METLKKQLTLRLDRDGFVKLASVAFAANLLPHRNMPAEAVAKQCFQNAHLWWEELQEYRRAHEND